MENAQIERDKLMQRMDGTGITLVDAQALRRVATTLSRWHEWVRGASGGYYSFVIKRAGDALNSPRFMVMNNHRTGQISGSHATAREVAELKRLGKIMARYPLLSYHIPTDPFGHSLYILRPGDVPEGQSAEVHYARGVAIF